MEQCGSKPVGQAGELVPHLVPAVLGAGERLFDDLAEPAFTPLPAPGTTVPATKNVLAAGQHMGVCRVRAVLAEEGKRLPVTRGFS